MKKRFALICLLTGIGTVGEIMVRAQGNLTPPGPPGPVMKTLDQIEPRTLIPALPYTITNSGSFYLGTNLWGTVGQAGITVRADNVTLDLNGFVLAGVSGSSSGVACPNAQSNLVVRNGTIRGWAGHGVSAGGVSNTRIDGLSISSNGGKGVFTGVNSSVETCTTTGNGDNGIQMGSASRVRNCVASQNSGSGIVTGADGLLEKCSATGNLVDGIQSGSGNTIRSCVASQNGAAGFQSGTGNNLIDCNAQGNLVDGINCAMESRLSGCLARANGRHGILSGDRTHIDHCDAQGNKNLGISGGAGVTVRASQATANVNGGIITGAMSHVTDCHAVANIATGIAAGDGSTVNQCTSDLNGGDGIIVTTECKVIGNNAHRNTSIQFSSGIHATGTKNHVADNTTTSNDRGITLDVGGNFQVRNVSGNNSVNYFGSANQLRGPILTRLDDPATSTQPWANFEY